MVGNLDIVCYLKEAGVDVDQADTTMRAGFLPGLLVMKDALKSFAT